MTIVIIPALIMLLFLGIGLAKNENAIDVHMVGKYPARSQ